MKEIPPKLGDGIQRQDGRICELNKLLETWYELTDRKRERRLPISLVYLMFKCGESLRPLEAGGTLYFPESTGEPISCMKCLAQTSSKKPSTKSTTGRQA